MIGRPNRNHRQQYLPSGGGAGASDDPEAGNQDEPIEPIRPSARSNPDGRRDEQSEEATRNLV